ncbi:Cation/multidrug efflux pump [Hahella chejuensis KCTC 2396]|uniref:Cation/multidrug efflux pump n=1 Tax=Hahella chejuensis (strain KCTC 2396) TaxID=349521 RepID=Q2S7Z8_HAHCH|nr:efflux RND transporter permease subunit [Hahella chejuensis]ABC33226.1 Cation/multidrug efflux pump [Hahella chejuensis KCTC 2396]
MRLPELAIRNHAFAWVAVLLLLGLGLVSFLTMPRSEDPQFDFPTTLTTVLYPGATPVDMERLVVDPIEDAINELEDLKSVYTEIEDGLVLVRTEFLYGSDPEDKFEDVVGAIQSIRSELPPDLARLKTEKLSPADVNILQIALVSGSASTKEFKYYAERLETRLERVSGVKRVDVKGLADLEVQVKADWVLLRRHGVSLDELAEVVRRTAQNLPGGYVNGDDRRFNVRTSGDYKDIETLSRTVVRARDGHAVYIGDLADIRLQDSTPTYSARYQGEPAVFITVVQRKGSNIFDVMAGVKTTLDSFAAELPDNFQTHLAHDQSVSVNERVDGFFENLWQGLLLVAVVVLTSLGARAAFVIVLAIPFSILIGLGWLDLTGFGLQQMSIVGLVIALGLLVDNAIVVTENVERYLRQGDNREDAAIKGTSQVGWAVVSGTVTTVLAFLPILLLQSGSGTFIRSMPVTVILTLAASLLIALTITPLLASRFLKGGGASSSRPGWLLRALTSFAEGPYARGLAWSLRHPWLVLIISAVFLAGALSLFGQVGVSLFPKAEKSMILVNVETPEGSTFESTRKAAQEVEQYLMEQPGVNAVATNIGKSNPRVYYNTMDSKQQPNYAQLLVQLTPRPYQEIEQWVSEQREHYKTFADAQVRFKEFHQGPPVQAPITIRVTGDNIEHLRQAAQDVSDIIANTDGAINVDAPISRHKVDLRVNINRDKAAFHHVSLDAIDRTVRGGLVGLNVGSLRDDEGEDYPIIVTARERAEPELDQFQRMMVANTEGVLTPLIQVADIELETAVPKFQHYNLERMAMVTADIKPGYQTEAVTNAIVDKLDAYSWPQGVHYTVGGEQENRKESFGGMAKALLVAVVGIFAVLVMQFRSFSQPLIIFAALPFAIIGAILGLYFTGNTFSFTAFVGLTSLVGIVVNNSIILVDYANQIRGEGVSVSEAMARSARTRLIPILLTSLTTIGGLTPLTLTGSSMWAPMGWTIIGGLTTSTLLTLFVVPALYRLFEGSGRQVKSLSDAQISGRDGEAVTTYSATP